MNSWYKSGSPWIWTSAGAVGICIALVLGMLFLIATKGLVYFWPKRIIEAEYKAPGSEPIRIIGELYEEESVNVNKLEHLRASLPADAKEVVRYRIKTGNREIQPDFKIVEAPFLFNVNNPKDVVVLERREWGNAYGRIKEVLHNGSIVATGNEAWHEFSKRIKQSANLFKQIRKIEREDIASINYLREKNKLKLKKLDLTGDKDPQKRAVIAKELAGLDARFNVAVEKLSALNKQFNEDSLVFEVAGGKKTTFAFSKVISGYKPNEMGFFARIWFYIEKFFAFLSDEPREANTEGGVFPCIFGTVMMVIIMSILVTPLGIIAALYLREYAKQGYLTQLIRIAVNNLAGVPSIVYGVFGLGFFVYTVGGSIDNMFYPEALPRPTFGSPGLLWSSITLAILTLPVVIVSTEEGLTRIPRAIREGSLALGATKAETLWKTVMPIASPAMMTGLILAVARAAGEVAPLMLVGVVKLAPDLPVDGNFPFIHLERKFMHLGFHIYDVGFQSPNIEAARPIVYATAFLLVAIIVILNLAAIMIRNRLREKYKFNEG